MKRILFVDDEPQVLQGLRLSLRKRRGEWDAIFAEGAQAGLVALASLPCDVVVADMRMPEMDGAAFLRIVAAEYPQTARIVLSGFADRPAVLRALGVAHQFLSKPCAAETLYEVLARACALQRFVGDKHLRGFMSRLTCLPSMAPALERLTAMLLDTGTSTAAIARVVEQDPALSAKLLQVVNAGSFAPGARVATVQQAVTLLGVDAVRNLLLSSALVRGAEQAPEVPGFSFERLQEHALLSARIARRLMPVPGDRAQAFTASLLANAGKLVLAVGWPDRFARVVRDSGTGVPAGEAERESFGFTHAEVGAYLLGLWGLPATIVEAVAFHHRPSSLALAGFELVVAVHIASVLADEIMPVPGITEPLLFDHALTEEIGLAASLPRWREIAEEESQLPEPAH
jgi:HD-like signal output (HDOD) protein/CheY-like chemotaxis protein